MSGKFMVIKKLVIPIMTFIVLTSQLTGCATVNSDEMVKMINSGQTITIEVAKPDYGILKTAQDEKKESLQNWIQLDQLKTHPEFRREFDKLLNITIVTENGVNGKSGCLYVDVEGDRNGNTTLADALRNEVFVNKYLTNKDTLNAMKELATKAYVDIQDTQSNTAVAAAINAYFNLLDEPGAKEFKANQLLTREDFYTLVFKAETPVQKLESDKMFELAIGGKTDKSIYAQHVADYGWLQTGTKSLDAQTYKGTISRAEAVYLVVNKYFPDLLDNEFISIFNKGFSDTKNAGDLAKRLGLKKNGVGKEKWQAYTLAYMLKHPDEGMQEELYRSMVVAKRLGLIAGEESRWDEAITKEEAIKLILNAHLARNDTSGFLTSVEYGKMNAGKFTVAYSEDKVLGYTEDGYAYGENWIEVPSGVSIIDPYQKVSGGLKLVEVKQMIKELEADWKKEGKSATEIEALKSEVAKGFGTTIETLNAIPDSEIAKYEQKVKEEKEIKEEAAKIVDVSKVPESVKKNPSKQTTTQANKQTNTKQNKQTTVKSNSAYSKLKVKYGRIAKSKDEIKGMEIIYTNDGTIPYIFEGKVYMLTESDIRAINNRQNLDEVRAYLSHQGYTYLPDDYIKGTDFLH